MSRVVSGRYSPPGADSVADAIRERRGARGITPLDASLLHVPHIAKGYNTLLGAIRTEGKLPGDIREAMVCDFQFVCLSCYNKSFLPPPFRFSVSQL